VHREDTVQSLSQAFANHTSLEDLFAGDFEEQSQVFQDNWRFRAGGAFTLSRWGLVFDEFDLEPDVDTFQRFIHEVLPRKYKNLVKLVLPPVKLGALTLPGEGLDDAGDREADTHGMFYRRLIRICDSSPLDITMAYVLDTFDFERFGPHYQHIRECPPTRRQFRLHGHDFPLVEMTGRRGHLSKITFRSKAEFRIDI
jgi:hypothetical protein